MSLPQAVQRQVNQVEAHFAQNNTAAVAATVLPDAQTPGTPAEPTPAPEILEVEQDWKLKYQTLQGKFNAEVPLLHKQLREANQTISQLQTQLAQQPTAQPPASVSDLVRQLEAATGSPDLGPILMNLIQSETSKAVAPVVQQVNQVNQQVAQVNQSVQQSAVDPGIETLRNLLKEQRIDFDTVDMDPMFSDWLNEIDPSTGVKRSQRFIYARDHLKDLKAVADFYVRFVRDPRWSVAQTTSGPQVPSLNQHVTVPATPAAQSVQPNVPVWTEASIKAFYENKRRGVYPPDEAERLEREILAFAASQA